MRSSARSVADVDIAMLLPARRGDLGGCKRQGSGAVGDRGSSTAPSPRSPNKKPYEITTLRRDVATDGRRATVALHRQLGGGCSLRRDFTMNALYARCERARCSIQSAGLPDLKAGRVRFIGDAGTRIKEDHLRILRLFRFHAWYKKGGHRSQWHSPHARRRAIRSRHVGKGAFRRRCCGCWEAESPLAVLADNGRVGHLVRGVAGPAEFSSGWTGWLRSIARRSSCQSQLLRLAALVTSDAQGVQLATCWRLSNDDRDRLRKLVGRHRVRIVS